jgi:SET domain-containing protein
MKQAVGMRYGRTLVVQPVRNGLGLVALRPLAAGDVILRVCGRIVSPATVWGYWKRDPRRGANCYRFDADHYLDPEGSIGAYCNHSCRPNSRLVRGPRALWLHALRPIRQGEEVTHDYSTQTGTDDVWTMRCNCGERRCRGVVAHVGRLPAAVLRDYQRREAIPRFILDTL